MEKLTIQQILEKISEAVENSDNEKLKRLKEEYGTFAGVENILDGLLTEEWNPEAMEKFFPSLLEVVNYESGGEGSAEDAPQCIYEYKPTGQLFGKDGWYQSYHGTDWNEGWHEFDKVPTYVYNRKR